MAQPHMYNEDQQAASDAHAGVCIIPGCGNGRESMGRLCFIHTIRTPEETGGMCNELADLFMEGTITSEDYAIARRQIGCGR